MKNLTDSEWVPLLVPDMPSPQAMLPWLERIQEAKHYSNFGPLVRELEADFSIRFGLPVEQVTTVANATQGLELVLQALDLPAGAHVLRSEEHTSELQSPCNLVCRLLLEKKHIE